MTTPPSKEKGKGFDFIFLTKRGSKLRTNLAGRIGEQIGEEEKAVCVSLTTANYFVQAGNYRILKVKGDK